MFWGSGYLGTLYFSAHSLQNKVYKKKKKQLGLLNRDVNLNI